MARGIMRAIFLVQTRENKMASEGEHRNPDDFNLPSEGGYKSSEESGTVGLIDNESKKYIQPRLNILKAVMYPTGAVFIIFSASPSFMSSWVEAEMHGVRQSDSVFLGILNAAGKQALLAVFFFPNIKITVKKMGETAVIYALGIPSALTFALYNLGTFDDFSEKVFTYNSTVANITLSPVLTDLAHWVQTPTPRVLSAFSAAIVNFLSNPGVMIMCYAVLSELGKEYKALSDKSQPEKVKFWCKTLGTLPAVGISEWGIFPYIFISKKLCVTYFHFPDALGYAWGAAQVAFMTLLVIDTAYALSRDGIKMFIEMLRKEFEYPSKVQITINVVKGAVTLGIVIPGTLHMIWANGYAGITSVATDVATGVASTFFEIFGIYTGLTLLEMGAKWLGNKAAESYHRKYPAIGVGENSVDAEEENAPAQPQTWRTWAREKMSFFGGCCRGNRGKVQQDLSKIVSGSGVSMEFSK
jgi:hypothetical protein